MLSELVFLSKTDWKCCTVLKMIECICLPLLLRLNSIMFNDFCVGIDVACLVTMFQSDSVCSVYTVI